VLGLGATADWPAGASGSCCSA